MSLCATCEYWKSNKEMTPLGFANCEHLPIWQLTGPKHSCVKHKQIDNPKKRIEWLRKKGFWNENPLPKEIK